MVGVPKAFARADARSLTLHREVAGRIRADPSLLLRAQQRVEDWAVSGTVHPHYVEAWRAALGAGIDEVLAILEDPGERGQALRQASPFAFVLSPRERWRALRAAREQMDP